MLVRLMYASRTANTVDPDAMQSILRQSKQNNPPLGITGLLCHCGSSAIFMQVLEGGRAAVNRLYLKISQDPRHSDVVLLSYEEIPERRFAGWTMGQVNMARLNPALLLKYSATPLLDPYSMSGAVSLAMFGELVATASIMGDRG
ncbi:MAG: BLUF domain-containing protein [Microbacteriaceae bacterium]|nr:BLUF domain-containing protein [Burkholderiaceae bacterium]